MLIQPAAQGSSIVPVVGVAQAGLTTDSLSSTTLSLLGQQIATERLHQIELRRKTPSEAERIGRIEAWVTQNGGSCPMTKVLIANRGDAAMRMIREVEEFNKTYG